MGFGLINYGPINFYPFTLKQYLILFVLFFTVFLLFIALKCCISKDIM